MQHRNTVHIVVDGHLGTHWNRLFDGLSFVRKDDGTTEITGPIMDQAHLHGLLKRVRDLRLNLVEVRQTREKTDIGRGKMKKVIVFGSTGRSGSAVVKRALNQGYAVTAFARSRGKIEITHPNLTVVQGDVLESESVENAIAGHDVVISSLGAGRNGTVRSQGTKNIIKAMENTGVTRLISQSSLGVGDSRSNLNALWKYVMFGMLLRKAYADHGRQEEYIRHSALDWTIVRPAALTKDEATGTYLKGFPATEKNINLKISIDDLAVFMVEQIEDHTYLHAAPGLSYRKGA